MRKAQHPAPPLVLELPLHSSEFQNDDYDFEGSAEGIAKARGQAVVYPAPNQLQLDLDSNESLLEFQRRWSNFSDGNFRAEVVVTPSRTKGHHHVYITFHGRTFNDAERIAYQQALGSDPMREFLNAKRLLFGVKNPTRLFEPKQP